jgi:hypothetical protein
MSTYGKKALIDWDYLDVDVSRFLRSPKNLQLDILEKWYPIGEPCLYNFTISEDIVEVVIDSYCEYVNFYTAIVMANNERDKVNTNIGKITMYRMIRDTKLDKLINKKESI